MKNYFYQVCVGDGNLEKLLEALEYYEGEYERIKPEVRIKGNLEQNAARLSQYVEETYTGLQMLEAILKFFNDIHKKVKGEVLRKYIENYNKALQASTAEKYADSDPTVIDLAIIINQIAYIRNLFLSLSKAFEVKHYQISNVTKLRTAGLDLVDVNYE